MTTVKLILATLMICWISSVAGQEPALGTKENREVLRMGLYPPDILMHQQQRLGISSDQRAAIAALVRNFQEEVTELQWAMPNEQQKLRTLLNAHRIDPQTALAQVAQVLKMESEFKQAHFQLLIAIKNALTREQIDMLDTAIRRRISNNQPGGAR